MIEPLEAGYTCEKEHQSPPVKVCGECVEDELVELRKRARMAYNQELGDHLRTIKEKAKLRAELNESYPPEHVDALEAEIVRLRAERDSLKATVVDLLELSDCGFWSQDPNVIAARAAIGAKRKSIPPPEEKT